MGLNNHTLVLLRDGTLKAWGANSYGQLGNGSLNTQRSPVDVPDLPNVKQLVGGGIHTLALLADGTVKESGGNWHNSPFFPYNLHSQYYYRYFLQSSPVTVTGLANVKQLVAGQTHSLALHTDGTVQAWGENYNGQLGIGMSMNQATPVPIERLTNVKQLVAGYSHSLALLEDGTVKAWGANYNGQLGIGNTYSHFLPTTVSGLTNVKQLVAGGSHTIALLEDGTLKAWGENNYGQLGIGNTVQQLAAVTVPDLTNVKQLVAGGSHSIALLEDGTLKAWGRNDYGQLGIGNTEDQVVPVTIPDLTNVKQLVAGGSHTFALLEDGTLKAWGRNDNGQLGIGNAESKLSPVTVPVSDVAMLMNEEMSLSDLFVQKPAITPISPIGSKVTPMSDRTIPRLVWMYHDIGNDEQTQIQIRITHATDNRLAYESTRLTLAKPYFDVPADAKLEVGNTYAWQVQITDSIGTVIAWSDKQFFTVSNRTPAFSLTAETTIINDTTFPVMLGLEHAVNIYAEDVTIQYDPTLFVLQEIVPVHEGIYLHQQETSAEGSIRLLLASKGDNYGLNSQTSLVQLIFQAKNVSGRGTVSIAKAQVADKFGVEQEASGGDLEITVLFDTDVSGDGMFSLSDVAIVATHYGTPAGEWTNPRVDFNKDGSVDDEDLTIMFDKMVKS